MRPENRTPLGGPRTSRRGDRFAVLALLLLVVASWMPRLEGPIDLRWDAAVYYILGTSLSEGKDWVFLRTGLKAVFPRFERNVARANQLMDSVPVRYVVVLDWLSRRYALEAVRNAPSAWQVVYSNNHCTIYERMKTEGVASKGA